MSSVVSVVIPTYNRADDLARALASLRMQTHPEWEALIVDNQSTDDTRSMIARLGDSRLSLFNISNNGVIAASRNKGIERASGAFVAFLDSDDSWHPEKLERSLYWLDQGFDFVYHDMRIVSTRHLYFGPRRFKTRQLTPPVHDDLLVGGNTIPTSSVVVRRQLLIDAGGFSENSRLIAGEDYDLWLRLASLTEQFKQVDGTLGILGRGDDNQFSARRLTTVLEEIEGQYVASLPAHERSEAHARWLDYAHGRSQYRVGDYVMARRYLLRVLTMSRSRVFRIKALYMLAAIAARKHL